jgi:predicted GNAT family N-acyltransferase
LIATTCKQIFWGTADFAQECAIRNAVLRVPLGLDLFQEDLTQESQQLHFGCFAAENKLIACVIAVILSNNAIKLRQMAVAPEYQRHGHGHQLIAFVENHLHQRGWRKISLHARMTAVGFYQRMGYVSMGSAFKEVGIPHMRMEKIFPAS